MMIRYSVVVAIFFVCGYFYRFYWSLSFYWCLVGWHADRDSAPTKDNDQRTVYHTTRFVPKGSGRIPQKPISSHLSLRRAIQAAGAYAPSPRVTARSMRLYAYVAGRVSRQCLWQRGQPLPGLASLYPLNLCYYVSSGSSVHSWLVDLLQCLPWLTALVPDPASALSLPCLKLSSSSPLNLAEVHVDAYQ